MIKEELPLNKFEKRSKISYDKKAGNYDKTFDGRFTEKFKRILVESVCIPDGGAVADIACGNGKLLKMLSENHSFKGFGADISDKMVEEAGKLNPSMEFYAAGCEKLPFEDNSMDVMTVCAAYHHFPDAEAFAREAKRTIKQGGLIYIAEVYLPAALRAVCNPFVKFSKAGDVKFYSTKEIEELFLKNGFSREKALTDGITELVVMRKI